MTDDYSIALTQRAELDRLALADSQHAMIDSHDDQISILQFWRVLQKRRWLVVISLAGVVSLVTAISLNIPKRYDVSSLSRIQIE